MALEEEHLEIPELRDLRSFTVVTTLKDNLKCCRRMLVQCPTTAQLYELCSINKDQNQKQLQHLRQVIGWYKGVLRNSCIRPLLHVQEFSNAIDLLFEHSSQQSLRDLVQTRGGLTEFEAKYFVREIYFVLCYLREKGLFLEKFDCADLMLDSAMKVRFSFLAKLNCIPKNVDSQAKPTDTSHYQHRNQTPFCNSESTDAKNIGLALYEMLEGKVLPVPVNPRRQADTQSALHFQKLANDSPFRKLIRKLLGCPSEQPNLRDLFASSGLLGGKVPMMLPSTIKLCAPSAEFQNMSLPVAVRTSIDYSTSQCGSPRSGSARQSNFNQQTSNAFQMSLGISTFKEFFGVDICGQPEGIAYVQEFCDISTALGYGYRMNTGLVGFYFNDKTLLITIPNEKVLTYFDENWEMRPIKEEKLTDASDIRKKSYILMTYVKSLTKMDSAATSNRLVYIKQYIRTKNARLFLISNNSVQSQFIDQSQVLCTNAESWTFDKKEGTFCPMSEDESPQVLLRERYTKELGRKLLGWISTDDFECGAHDEIEGSG